MPGLDNSPPTQAAEDSRSGRAEPQAGLLRVPGLPFPPLVRMSDLPGSLDVARIAHRK